MQIQVCVRVCACGGKYAASFNFLATRPCWYQHLTEYVCVCLLINLTEDKDALFRNFWPIKNADHNFLSKIALILKLPIILSIIRLAKLNVQKTALFKENKILIYIYIYR